MLKPIALLLLSVSLGMGGAVALTLSHGVQHERHASLPAHTPKPEMGQTSAGKRAVLPDTAQPAARPAALPDQAASVVQPDLPRHQPRPRPALSAPVVSAPALSAPAPSAPAPSAPAPSAPVLTARPSGAQPLPPQLSISTHSAPTPLWQPPAAPDRQPGLLHADGGINYNPWKTGVYR